MLLDIILCVNKPRWRNWQTRTVEGCVPYGVEVQVLSGAIRKAHLIRELF